MSETLDKDAMEKARAAWSAAPVSTREKRMEAAILAYLANAPISEEMVEQGARGICKARELDWDAQLSFTTSATGGDDEQEAFRHEARACLTAAREAGKGEG